MAAVSPEDTNYLRTGFVAENRADEAGKRVVTWLKYSGWPCVGRAIVAGR